MQKLIRCSFLIALLALFYTSIQAQSGSYFMTNFSHKDESIDNTNYDIVQDNKGVICIANRAGILRFDGNSWEHIVTPGAIYALDKDPFSNTIYTGGYSGIGKLEYDQNQQLEYFDLLDSSSNVGEVTDIIYLDNKVFGLSNNEVLIFDEKSKTLKIVKSEYSGDLYKLHQIDQKIYVSTGKSGLQLVGEKDLEEPLNDQFDRLDVEFISGNPAGNEYLIGTYDNELYRLKNNALTSLKISDEEEYLKNSGLLNGVWVSDSITALATLKGGVIFINLKSKKIDQIVNYQSGLPDNEIFAFAIDTNKGIWVSHSGGFTRISPYLPFRSFNKYEGLKGKILSVINHDDSLYVGTSLGLYYLQKVENFEEVKVREKKTVTKNVNIPKSTEEDRKGLFGLFKKKEEDTKPITQKQTRTFYKTSVKQELKSVDYVFKKVENINSKVQHFANFGKDLYCGGLDGIFKIDGLKSKQVTNLPVHYFTLAEKSKMIIAATYDQRIKSYSLENGNKEIELFYDFKDKVDHIFEDDQKRIWLSSSDEVYYVKVEDGTISESNNYPIRNPYVYTTLGASVDGKPLFINESGEYSIDFERKQLSKLETAEITRYIAGVNGEVWVYKSDHWKKLRDENRSVRLNLISLFKNIRYISSDTDGNNWVVTENNEVYKIFSNDLEVNDPYDLYLKYIKNSDQPIILSDKLKFDQTQSALLFEFAQPEFSGILDVKYQYKLEGFDDDWSDWSGNHNVISFPYLPEGKYKLLVRSKSVLGVISEIEPIEFQIVPPYWKRPWFYAFEFSALAILLFVSVRMKYLGFKYRLASRLLALVTLIIIIEFIQTVAENEFSSESSPVFDFLIQVTVAIIVLPVESLIRKYIFKEKNVQILDFIELKNKK